MNRAPKFLLALVATVVALVAVSVLVSPYRPTSPSSTGPSPAPSVTGAPTGPRPNVILLTIDTLRPDHLGAYGYPRPTSPNLDRLAAQSVLFEDAVSSSAWTSPGLVSLLTGLFAVRHGVTGPASSVPPGTPTLATLLREAGYQVPNLVYLTSIPNYANLGFGPPDTQFFGDGDRDELLAWLDHQPPEPYFLWFHYRYVHLPYAPPVEQAGPFWSSATDPGSPMSEGLRAVREDVIVPRASVRFELPADREAVTALYDGEIHAMDEWLGRVLERLNATGALERSLLVVTADHGEELFEHGWVGHASTTLQASLHEEVIRIPLLMRFPGGDRGGRRITDQVRGVDVLPTVLGHLGIEAPPGLDGQDLGPAIGGKRFVPTPAFLESAIAGYQTPPDRDGEELAGIRIGGWKMVMARGGLNAALYHTRVDHDEVHDLLGTGFPEEAELRNLLVAFLGRHDPSFLVTGAPPPSNPAVTVPADTPCPEIEAPRDGATVSFKGASGVVRARWTGRSDLDYVLDYELGEGRFHTVGKMPVHGNSHDFGPFPRGVWRSFGDFNPWRVSVSLAGQSGCDKHRIEFRFEATTTELGSKEGPGTD